MFCYLLYTDKGHTYIGATTDVNRRLRQHNQEITGGARATGRRVQQGYEWKRLCYLTLPEWRTALQVEWKWKQICRKQCGSIRDPIKRRLTGLQILLSLEKPTRDSIPYDAYPTEISIHWESDTYRQQYDEICQNTKVH